MQTPPETTSTPHRSSRRKQRFAQDDEVPPVVTGALLVLRTDEAGQLSTEPKRGTTGPSKATYKKTSHVSPITFSNGEADP